MVKKGKIERILEKHYKDQLDLNKRFINSMSRPRIQFPNTLDTTSKLTKKLSKKQLQALARGRKILASKRSNKPQI